MIEVSSLNQSYGQSQVLWDLNLRIETGRSVSLMGRNGVGKTTLLKCLMGLLPVDSGAIIYDGMNLTQERAERRAALGIGYVPQGRMIFPLLTVEENLQVGFAALPKDRRRLPDQVFEYFPVLERMLKRRGGDLSGGQQQQLAIARALVLRPKLLILDEPTEGLQPNIVQEIGEILVRLKRDLGMTVLVVEQKLHFVRSVSDAFFIMTKGAIVAAGPMSELDEELIAEHLLV
ncbi:MAG: urea ABC transporter ATP-binding subunit UrtE [Gammaproteobacteria bacterium]|nr:urea ABC transporter ATP-binding subunit UrtE [Gammaproteobacteria bacterium]